MKLYRVQAIVLNSREMRDAHRVLTLFSREQGKLRVAAHGVDKPASRKRGAVQPFCHSEFLLRCGRELDSVSQCEGRDIFPGLRTNLQRMGYAAYVAELVDGLTADGEPNENVFRLLLHTLRALEKTGDAELVARGFTLRLLSVLGYMPHLNGCVDCGGEVFTPRARFSAAAGGLICPECAPGIGEVDCGREAVAAMKSLLSWDPCKIDRIRISSRSREEIRTVLDACVQWHMEKRSRSMQFMEKLQTYLT